MNCLNCDKKLKQIEFDFDYQICLNCQLSCNKCKVY